MLCRKIKQFLSEKGKKDSQIQHFNIFFMSKSLSHGLFFISLLTECIKINPKEEIFMANKRTLKRAIHSICEGLFAEALAISLYGPEVVRENAEATLFSIVKLEDDYLCRISHPEPGMKPKAYFKDLGEKFSAQVSEILDQLNG